MPCYLALPRYPNNLTLLSQQRLVILQWYRINKSYAARDTAI